MDKGEVAGFCCNMVAVHLEGYRHWEGRCCESIVRNVRNMKSADVK